MFTVLLHGIVHDYRFPGGGVFLAGLPEGVPALSTIWASCWYLAANRFASVGAGGFHFAIVFSTFWSRSSEGGCVRKSFSRLPELFSLPFYFFEKEFD